MTGQLIQFPAVEPIAPAPEEDFDTWFEREVIDFIHQAGQLEVVDVPEAFWAQARVVRDLINGWVIPEVEA